ncbi:MAG TPA: glycosyltransferase family 39 protein [Bacteroidia bacterium]
MPNPNHRSLFNALLWVTFFIIYLIVQFLYGSITQAYFWDELNVYYRAAEHLNRFGLGITPDAIPDEFSRGHPILVPFYFGLCFKLFGAFPITAHIAAALLSCLGFHFLYRILSEHIDAVVAFLITLCIFVQPVFLSQSLLLLPEMPLFTATAVALYHYQKHNYKFVCLFLMIALQIKESALVLPPAFILIELLHRKKLEWRPVLALFIIPLLSFCLYFTIQYFQKGYFFYPLHTGLTKFDPYFIRERWNEFKSFAWIEQAHYLFILPALAVLHQYKLISSRLGAFFTIFIVASAFTVLNYFLSRYTVYFLAPFYSYSLYCLYLSFKKQLKLFVPYVVICLIGGIYFWYGNKFSDTDFTPSSHVKNLHSTLQFLRSPEFKGKTIHIDFPLYACYMDKHNGYNTEKSYNTVVGDNHVYDYRVFTFPGNVHDTIKLSTSDTIVKRLSNRYAYTLIYKKHKTVKDSLLFH